MKKYFKFIRTLFVLFAVMTVATSACACGDGNDKNNNNNGDDTIKLSFKASSSYEYLKKIDGKKVEINGYMATSSPVDGSFLFLMNLPYQSCPFCIPNTSQLSNTMEVYPKKGESFGYTNQAIKVVGTLCVAEDPDQPFTDQYGYLFNFKIIDATYSVVNTEELSQELALWQKIANSNVINDIYKMYDYLNFLCAWNTYFVNSYTDANGDVVHGYYISPDNAKDLIYTEGAQFNYGYQDGYFNSIINKIQAVDQAAFAQLVANVQKAENLANKALAELGEGNYTSEYKYLDKFDRKDYVYTLNKGAELAEEMQQIYQEFSNWLAGYEM